MSTWVQGIRYAYRYTQHKFGAFQAFGAVNGSHLPHSVIKPVATYSPWRADHEFQSTFQSIRHNTLVDFYRCYELWELVAEVAKFASGDIIEVGVWRGGTGCLIARRAQLCGINAKVYLCDTFRGVVKAGPQDSQYQGGEHADTTEEHVFALGVKLGLPNIRILTGVFPDETGPAVADSTFRLCHIDVDVYESGKQILEWVWPKVVKGGVVVFDDYGALSTGGITQLVNEERRKSDRLMVHNLNGHAVFVKL